MISNDDTKNTKFKRNFLKNAIRFFQKVLLKENELNEQNKKEEHNTKNCSTKIISRKLLQDIEKEKNKIVSKRKRNSAMFSSNFNHIHNAKTSSFFKFGEITKKNRNF